MDSYAKQWRIFADCFNNVGTLSRHSHALCKKVEGKVMLTLE